MYLSNAKFINDNLPEINNRVDLKELRLSDVPFLYMCIYVCINVLSHCTICFRTKYSYT